MRQRAIILLGILGVFLSLSMGAYSLIPWEIVAVLVAVSLGIPSLVLMNEKASSRESTAPRKVEAKHEKEKTGLPTLTKEEGTPKSALLPDIAEITKLSIDDSLLDKIYEQANRTAIDLYHDSKLCYFAIQVLPYETYGATVCIYLDFYSKWADKTCRFQYSDLSGNLEHRIPDKAPIVKSYVNAFDSLPWKMSSHWRQFLDRAYVKIRPLPAVEGTCYHLTCRRSHATSSIDWSLKFDDGLSGKEYWFK